MAHFSLSIFGATTMLPSGVTERSPVRLGKDLVHFGGGEGPAGVCMDVPHRPDLQNPRSGCLVVGSVEDEYAVVIAERPVNVGDFYPHLLRPRLQCRRTL